MQKKHVAQEKKYDTELLTQQKNIQKILTSLNRSQEEQQTNLANQQKFETWANTLRDMSLPIIKELLAERSLAKLYNKAQGDSISYKDQDRSIESQITKILRQLGSYLKEKPETPEAFINTLQKEYENISAFQQKRDSVIDGVINTFVNPTQSFLKRYQELKKYIKTLSSKIDSYHISDIQKIELDIEDKNKQLNELEQISLIKEVTPLLLEGAEHSERMELLRGYIERQRTIKLTDLFTFQLKLTKRDGKKELLNMNKQMQSKGSDKMIRIFLFLMLLKQFFVGKPSNRLVIYVDEIGAVDNENIERLLSLCAQYHVLPIFAWTEMKEGFDKHYLLFPSPENEGKLYVDEGSLIKKD